MKITRHAGVRCQQRGIKEGDVSLIAEYGTWTRGGAILTRKDIARVELERKRLAGRLSRLDGVFVATDGETAITVYRADRASVDVNLATPRRGDKIAVGSGSLRVPAGFGSVGWPWRGAGS